MRSLQGAFYATLVLVSGAIAAVLAHAAIDFAGDFLLAHDTYDGIEHHSRAIFGGLVLAAAALVALRYLWEALDRRCGSLTSLLRQLRTARGVSPWRFVLLVVIVALVALVAMEWTDAVLDGVRIDGLEDLLGGSLALGLSITIVAGIGVGWLVRLGLHALADWEPVLCAFLASLLPHVRGDRALAPQAYHPLTVSLDGACRLARRCGKRAPPLFTPA